MPFSRKACPSDASEAEWALFAPHPTLLREDAGQRERSLRCVGKAGAPWRWMPDELPPWEAVCRQAQR